ncbi:MAG: DUF6345 domain-containing protein [Solirubrobacteraceae bacterium]
MCGACSVETFVNQGALSLTHEDAAGWLNYLRSWHVPNFHFQDANVQVWQYEESYDNYEDTYGADAVVAFYHSGHGGMGTDGNFWAPMGGMWDGRSDAVASNMGLGNEIVNYIFWSTCNSCRVKEGHTPIRTWHKPNLGFRMLFGFETVSVDNGDYGRFFWEEYNRPKSFARAWLDASWRISQGQEPSVVAVGSSAQEADARLQNERTLEWGHVPASFYSWLWYDKARSADGTDALAPRSLSLPDELLVAELRPPADALGDMHEIARRFDLPAPAGPSAGLMLSASDGHTFSVTQDGRYEVTLGEPNHDNAQPLTVEEAKRRATEALGEHGLDRDIDVEFDSIRRLMAGGGGAEDDGGGYEARVIETTVQFRQMINGLPVVSQDAGDVRLTFDNDGQLTRIENTARRVERLSDRPKTAIAGPGAGSGGLTAYSGADPERLLEEAWRGHRVRAARSSDIAEGAQPVADTTEVGYQFRGNEGRLVARREVEVDFGGGIRKRYEVVAPIVG